MLRDCTNIAMLKKKNMEPKAHAMRPAEGMEPLCLRNSQVKAGKATGKTKAISINKPQAKAKNPACCHKVSTDAA